METSGRNISFLVNKEELKLIEDACEYGADADHVLNKPKIVKKLAVYYCELNNWKLFNLIK